MIGQPRSCRAAGARRERNRMRREWETQRLANKPAASTSETARGRMLTREGGGAD